MRSVDVCVWKVSRCVGEFGWLEPGSVQCSEQEIDGNMAQRCYRFYDRVRRPREGRKW